MAQTIGFQDLDTLTAKLRAASVREAVAMTRLRRAQTLYDKYYNTRARLQNQINDVHDHVNHVTARITGKKGHK